MEGFTLKQKKRWLLITAVLSLGALVAAGCGDDDDDGTAATTTAAGGEATTTTAGGGGDMVEGRRHRLRHDGRRDVAAGNPLPGTAAAARAPPWSRPPSSQFMSPPARRRARRVEKENIKIELSSLARTVPQMANGQIDVAVGGIEAALFNAGYRDQPVKAVLANYFTGAGDYRSRRRACGMAGSLNRRPDLKEIEKMALAPRSVRARCPSTTPRPRSNARACPTSI
jgi:hypothetical protein